MIDTNPRQFERQGNPWHGDGKISRSKRIRLGITRPGLPRRPERWSREESEAMTEFRDCQRIAKLVAAANGNGRAVAKPEPVAPLFQRIEPPRNSELTGWQKFERQCTRVIQRAEVQARCERISREEEREKLRATIAAATRRLGELLD